MDRRLEGRVTLVTGGTSGIGAACAERFGKEGATVVTLDISEGADHVVDVTDEAAVQAAVDGVVASHGRIDIVVNSAGTPGGGPVHLVALEEWRRVIDVNLTGQFLCCRAAVRRFLAQDGRPDLSRARGKIVCVSSVHEVIPWAGHVNYAASKGGVMLMMKSLAQEVAPRRIRVNSIAPGAIRTPINRQAWETEEALRSLLTLIPYGRIGEPEDVAKAAVWLASDESDYVTGTSLFVDGGMTLYPGFEDNG